MISFLVHLRVRPQNAAALEALLADVAAKSFAQEPGVLYYAFARSVDEPDTYVVMEVYRDAAAQAAHMATAWVRDSLPQSARLIEGAPQIRQYVSPGAEPVRQRAFPADQAAGGHSGRRGMSRVAGMRASPRASRGAHSPRYRPARRRWPPRFWARTCMSASPEAGADAGAELATEENLP
jgi:quinol monooxygenase YgiN